MHPADQGLGAGRRSGFQINLRLVVKDEFAPGEGAMQAGFDRLPLDGACAHLSLEEVIVVSATFLGLVHRGVRALDQRLGIRTVVGVDADPDGDVDMQLVVRDIVRRDERGDDLLRTGRRIVRVLDL